MKNFQVPIQQNIKNSEHLSWQSWHNGACAPPPSRRNLRENVTWLGGEINKAVSHAPTGNEYCMAVKPLNSHA